MFPRRGRAATDYSTVPTYVEAQGPIRVVLRYRMVLVPSLWGGMTRTGYLPKVVHTVWVGNLLSQ